jgi:hypothetical protein
MLRYKNTHLYIYIATIVKGAEAIISTRHQAVTEKVTVQAVSLLLVHVGSVVDKFALGQDFSEYT